jgi:hypothetical protein
MSVWLKKSKIFNNNVNFRSMNQKTKMQKQANYEIRSVKGVEDGRERFQQATR